MLWLQNLLKFVRNLLELIMVAGACLATVGLAVLGFWKLAVSFRHFEPESARVALTVAGTLDGLEFLLLSPLPTAIVVVAVRYLSQLVDGKNLDLLEQSFVRVKVIIASILITVTATELVQRVVHFGDGSDASVGRTLSELMPVINGGGIIVLALIGYIGTLVIVSKAWK